MKHAAFSMQMLCVCVSGCVGGAIINNLIASVYLLIKRDLFDHYNASTHKRSTLLFIAFAN